MYFQKRVGGICRRQCEAPRSERQSLRCGSARRALAPQWRVVASDPSSDRSDLMTLASPTKKLRKLWMHRSLTTTFETSSRRSQLYFVTKLFFRLAWMTLRGSPMWVFNVLRLVAFAAALMPALLRCAWYWYSEVRINVPYGPGLRHLCDVYPVERREGDDDRGGRGRGPGAPVVIFVAGGAWVIGYKAWGVPLGRALSLHGVLTVAPDYRNCPHCGVDGMVADVDRAVAWCRAHVAEYGGDPKRMVLVGQSAGAHLCALVLLSKLLRRRRPRGVDDGVGPGDSSDSSRETEPDDWKPADLKGFVGVSGPYHVHATASHWRAKGFGQVILDFIFGDEAGIGVDARGGSRSLQPF